MNNSVLAVILETLIGVCSCCQMHPICLCGFTTSIRAEIICPGQSREVNSITAHVIGLMQSLSVWLQLNPFLLLSFSASFIQDRRGQTSGARLSGWTRSLQQRSRTSTGDPSSDRERWRSRTSPSTPSQWLSESREWPKASSESWAWLSEWWREVGMGFGWRRGHGGKKGWRHWIFSVWIVVEGQRWCFFPSLQLLTLLFHLPNTSSLVSGPFTCTESPDRKRTWNVRTWIGCGLYE